jgi:hypothetical protein
MLAAGITTVGLASIIAIEAIALNHSVPQDHEMYAILDMAKDTAVTTAKGPK